MADVRSVTGTPVAADFASSSGTPIVVDRTSGAVGAYVLDNAGTVQPLAGGGGGGAPAGASYLTLALDATLTAERVLTAGTNITFVDTGANGTLTISAASASWTETEVDFGSTPKQSAQFTVTDAAIGATSKVAVLASGKAATGRAAGDDLWDTITYSAKPAAGSMTVYAYAVPGPVVGKRKIQYQVA